MKHLKISDLCNQHKPLFVTKITFNEKFPEVECVFIKAVESDMCRVLGERYCDGQFPFINCNNKSCYGGGVDFRWILEDMISKKEISRNEAFYCNGWEGSPKGRIKRGKCYHRFEVNINIKYKEIA